jgi:hypothetical protein
MLLYVAIRCRRTTKKLAGGDANRAYDSPYSTISFLLLGLMLKMHSTEFLGGDLAVVV